MTSIKTSYNRRSFLKVSAAAGGGFALGFSWLASCTPIDKSEEVALEMPDEWFDINAYLKIGDNGVVTIYTPNPEFGQNVMTSMPMLVAEELDVDWKKVVVEMAPYNPKLFGRQMSGGSMGILTRWDPLRMAGASAKHMLKAAAAEAWQVPAEEITTQAGMLKHEASGQEAHYGEMAAAASQMEVPEKVDLKDPKDFTIIGSSKKNVVGRKIVTGQPLFSMDFQKEGMKVAMIEHPPAFGMSFKSIKNAEAIKAMPGILDVFTIKTYKEDQKKSFLDANAFPELVAIVGDSTWEVLQAKRALEVDWQPFDAYKDQVAGWGGNAREVTVPAGLESTAGHQTKMNELAAKPGRIVRRDGDPEAAFSSAAKVIERTYSAPYLAHNCMEPMNAFAHVEGDKVWIAGPLQGPGTIESTIATRMDVPAENIEIEMMRMGGGFGRRAYSHYMLEAALISQKVQLPVKLMYTREDDMTNGIYRPTYQATFKAALNEQNELLAIHIKAGGVPESPLFANRFPAGAIDNYLAEEWAVPSNITIGFFRAPRSNFMAGAEQSFLDELAEAMGKDPIDFRLALLERAQNDPVGEKNDYDPARYAGVLELVKEKANWNVEDSELSRGVSAYFCHNTYAAHILDLKIDNDKPVVEKVTCAIDCGIVVNKDAAVNMAEGGIVDGIGNAFFGELSFNDGAPEKKNFDSYRMIRMQEAPLAIDVHFVDNGIKPTGLGEPPFPPIFGAVANAMYKATGERQYKQPFLGNKQVLG
ncbi:MAG: molybdopterin cofactor-binding domain-containing protein [Bacteroidota bacterium]